MLSVAVVGCGTGGPAAALLLAAAGHQVEVFERVPEPSPVGAGVLLQPTGQAVLARLGLLEEVEARCGRRCSGPGIPVHTGVEVSEVEDGRVIAGQRYDLVIAADGARSCLRPPALVRRARTYPWGALWAVLDDPEERHGETLAQVYRGTKEMLGFLASGRPAGVPQVSLFWSVPVGRLGAHTDLEAWKADVRRLTPRADHLLAQVTQLLPAVYVDVVMRHWHAGRLVFVGDSGHAMSPQLGQGVNLALLDAHVLARCLERHAGVDAALAACCTPSRGSPGCGASSSLRWPARRPACSPRSTTTPEAPRRAGPRAPRPRRRASPRSRRRARGRSPGPRAPPRAGHRR